jgi:hypothetical protein
MNVSLPASLASTGILGPGPEVFHDLQRLSALMTAFVQLQLHQVALQPLSSSCLLFDAVCVHHHRPWLLSCSGAGALSGSF